MTCLHRNEKGNFCSLCGAILKNIDINATNVREAPVTSSAVDEVFKKMGWSDKDMAELGVSKQSILNDLKIGTKPKDDVIIRGDNGVLGTFEQ